jgi:hypothetical protein
VLLLLVTVNLPSSPILVTLMMEAIRSTESSVVTRATGRNIPEGDIILSHRRGKLKSYALKMYHFFILTIVRRTEEPPPPPARSPIAAGCYDLQQQTV